MATIIMRSDWLVVRSDEGKVVLRVLWKEELGLFGFNSVYSYVVPYLNSDMIFGI